MKIPQVHRPIRLALAAAIVLTTAYVFIFRTSEEDAVRSTLESLRRLAEVDSKLSLIESAEKVTQLLDYVESEVALVALPEYDELPRVFRRESDKQQGIAVYGRLSRLEISLKYISIVVTGATAAATVDISVLASLVGAQGQFLEMHRVEVILQKQTGLAADPSWRIAAVRQLENLRDSEQAEAQLPQEKELR